MASPLLDFKKFKHVKSDDKSTTLQHKDGHVLTIAHNVLSSANREQLKALSKMPAQDATEGQKQESQDSNQYGKVIMKAEGGKPVPRDFPGNGGNVPQMAEGGRQMLADGTTDLQPKTVMGIPIYGTGLAEADQVKHLPPRQPAQYQPTDLQSADWFDPAVIAQAKAEKAARDAQQQPQTQPQQPQQPQPQPQPQAQGGQIRQKYAEAGKVQYGPPEAQPPMPDVSGLPQGRGVPQMQQPDPEQQVITPAAQQAMGWLMSPSGMPDSAVPAADVAATKADAAADGFEQKKEEAEKVADVARDDAANSAEPLPQPKQIDAAGLAQEGLSQEQEGEQTKAAAVQQQAKDSAQALEHDVKQKQDIQDWHTKSFQELNNERQALQSDIQKGFVDPNKFWTGDENGNGSHSRIAAGIGMVLAGFNPTSRPNAAIDFLNHQIDRNVDAQKTNLNAKNNLLAMNLQQFRNLQDASDMTRVMQADVVKSQLMQAANQNAGQFAKAAAQSATGQIDAKYQPIFMNLQMRQMMQGLGNGGVTTPGSTGKALSYLDMANPQAAKDYRARYYAPFDVPGGKSIADREIPEADRNQLNAQSILDAKGKDILAFIGQHSGTWNPQTRAVAAQKVEEMKNFYNDSIHGGALTEGRLGWYDEQFKKHPTDILAQMMGNTDKLKEMVSSNEARKNMTLKSYGLRPPPGQQQPQQQQHPHEGKTGTLKDNTRVKMTNGVWKPI